MAQSPTCRATHTENPGREATVLSSVPSSAEADGFSGIVFRVLHTPRALLDTVRVGKYAARCFCIDPTWQPETHPIMIGSSTTWARRLQAQRLQHLSMPLLRVRSDANAVCFTRARSRNGMNIAPWLWRFAWPSLVCIRPDWWPQPSLAGSFLAPQSIVSCLTMMTRTNWPTQRSTT